MKKSSLILFFTSYCFFLPIIMINCGGADIPYEDQGEETTESQITREDCETQTFVTENCVGPLTQETAEETE